MRAFFLLLSMLLAACTSPPPSPSRDDSLYRGLGEHQGITRIVEDALLNASRNPRLVLRMAEIDADSLRLKLIEQICVASGGPCVATGGASLSATEFDALLDDLRDAMAGQGVAMSVQRRLLARLAPARGAVMDR